MFLCIFQKSLTIKNRNLMRKINKVRGLLLLAQTDAWHKTIRLRTEHTTRSTKVRRRVCSVRYASKIKQPLYAFKRDSPSLWFKIHYYIKPTHI